MSKIFNEKDVQKIFDGFDSYTQDDADKVMNNSDRIEKIVSNGTLSKFMKDVKLYFRMLSDVFS